MSTTGGTRPQVVVHHLAPGRHLLIDPSYVGKTEAVRARAAHTWFTGADGGFGCTAWVAAVEGAVGRRAHDGRLCRFAYEHRDWWGNPYGLKMFDRDAHMAFGAAIAWASATSPGSGAKWPAGRPPDGADAQATGRATRHTTATAPTPPTRD